MAVWIKVDDRLPQDGQLVLVETNEDNCFYTDEHGRKRLWRHHVALFQRGKVPDDDDVIEFADQEGNNEVPYAWRGDGPCDWDGQEVVRWMPIPQ